MDDFPVDPGVSNVLDFFEAREASGGGLSHGACVFTLSTAPFCLLLASGIARLGFSYRENPPWDTL